MPIDQQQPLSILRLGQVVARTGRSRSSIYADVSAGRFPAAVRIGARAVGWLAGDIDAWIAARVAETRREAA